MTDLQSRAAEIAALKDELANARREVEAWRKKPMAEQLRQHVRQSSRFRATIIGLQEDLEASRRECAELKRLLVEKEST